MKTRILFLIIYLTGYTSLHAQQFAAEYDVVKEFYGKKSTGETLHVATLNLKGYYYMKGSKVISFQKPLYLPEYPEGEIVLKSPGSYSSEGFGIMMDSFQVINYLNLDSMVKRYRNDISGLERKGSNMVTMLTTPTTKWELGNEIKEISGLKCKSLKLNFQGKEIFEGWYAVDIPMPTGLYGFRNLPGLLVKGDYKSIHEKFKLTRYSFEDTISDDVFWPPVFNQPFKESDSYKTYMQSKK